MKEFSFFIFILAIGALSPLNAQSELTPKEKKTNSKKKKIPFLFTKSNILKVDITKIIVRELIPIGFERKITGRHAIELYASPTISRPRNPIGLPFPFNFQDENPLSQSSSKGWCSSIEFKYYTKEVALNNLYVSSKIKFRQFNYINHCAGLQDQKAQKLQSSLFLTVGKIKWIAKSSALETYFGMGIRLTEQRNYTPVEYYGNSYSPIYKWSKQITQDIFPCMEFGIKLDIGF